MPLTAHYKTKIYLGSQSAGVGTKGGSEIARKEKREGKTAGRRRKHGQSLSPSASPSVLPLIH